MARWQPAEREARYYKARRAGKIVVVSEGDSWFDYPMYRNIIDHIDDTKRFALKRLEFSGDTVRNMIGNARALEAFHEVVKQERPRFVLFSGGGNDIVGDELIGAIKPYNSAKWTELRAGVVGGYEKMIRTIGPDAPVFAHGYDYIIPSARPVRYDGIAISGPWVWKEMDNKGLPDAMKMQIARLMMDWFNDMLAELERVYPAYFAHIDLRGTLQPDMWQNEIHPTRSGFAAVAERFLEQLDSSLSHTLPRHDAYALGLS
jgi:hypothetical protein